MRQDVHRFGFSLADGTWCKVLVLNSQKICMHVSERHKWKCIGHSNGKYFKTRSNSDNLGWVWVYSIPGNHINFHSSSYISGVTACIRDRQVCVDISQRRTVIVQRDFQVCWHFSRRRCESVSHQQTDSSYDDASPWPMYVRVDLLSDVSQRDLQVCGHLPGGV